MKRIIPIRVQRIIMFIPLVNVLVLFVWLYNFSRSNQPKKTFLKSLMVIFATTIPLILIRIFLERLLVDFPSVMQVVHFLTLYLIPFNMAYSLIKFQQKHSIADN